MPHFAAALSNLDTAFAVGMGHAYVIVFNYRALPLDQMGGRPKLGATVSASG